MAGKALGVGMLSGGLDSALATKLLIEAGIEVRCLHFFTGFCITGHHSRVGRTGKPLANRAVQVAAELGVPLQLVDISEEYLEIILHPRYGYGANMNPCIDCRIFMLKKAREYMEKISADFVFTGEVVGQRPMSQMRRTLDLIERSSDLEGELLRPLSARLLPPTKPEEMGLVNREKLLDLQGRSRKYQLELARKYNITSYSQPAGGCCFLTDKSYSRRFRDALKSKGKDKVTMDDIYLLGVGRHFRISSGLKLIIGRDEAENLFLGRYDKWGWTARAKDYPGPTALILGDVKQGDWEEIASMVARYCDGKDQDEVEVEFTFEGSKKNVKAAPAGDELINRVRV